ncbi:hypothetical protein STRTUCAR8_04363, partial [Streptomyces turgidiscabies Car8]
MHRDSLDARHAAAVSDGFGPGGRADRPRGTRPGTPRRHDRAPAPAGPHGLTDRRLVGLPRGRRPGTSRTRPGAGLLGPAGLRPLSGLNHPYA